MGPMTHKAFWHSYTIGDREDEPERSAPRVGGGGERFGLLEIDTPEVPKPKTPEVPKPKAECLASRLGQLGVREIADLLRKAGYTHFDLDPKGVVAIKKA